MAETWSSWAGAVHCAPRRIARPTSEAEIAGAVRRAGSDGDGVRVVGTGHSSMPLCATEGVLVSLDDWQGLEGCDRARRHADVRAGTKLSRLSALLLEQGLALENLGDVDVQSVGGALGTGTHGTGRTLQNLSARVLALRLVLASGDVVECDAACDPDLLRAARVSLGALGIVSCARLALLPAYRLHERVWQAPIEELLPEVAQRVDATRHFEFFWFPKPDRAEVKTLQPTDADPASVAGRKGERIGWSGEILPSVRELEFHEMEYAVPEAAGLDCFRAVRERMRAKHPDVVWPVEYRTLAPDDAWLSPAHGRATVTISVHQDGRLPFRDFFADVEPILRGAGGRPHWGKIHTCSREDLRARYPLWDRFVETRRRLDPRGRFLNAHLRELFE
jgi:FAD/FMN-containing dehydrogenase